MRKFVLYNESQGELIVAQSFKRRIFDLRGKCLKISEGLHYYSAILTIVTSCASQWTYYGKDGDLFATGEHAGFQLMIGALKGAFHAKI
ncbi:MAG: hypothetical protein PHR78_03195 [Eubacteriales bacterium]|nr:hypothetical protein [Eubacteriales bacterium]MDD4324631.1 hypothetical protein [Eubacteriales bacterium]MDD4541159.1 hypothetical protein [Eubacteriales bacterium]